jgi:hypothetical protein
MSRHHLEWTNRFSEYLAGGLGDAERADVEGHLADCGACREALADLRDLVTRAGELGALEPTTDLWPGIAAALGGRARPLPRPEGRAVIELPSARTDAARALTERAGLEGFRRRIGLVAAAATLVALSVGTTWWVANATGGATEALRLGGLPGNDGVLSADSGTPPADLASELATLEEVLQAARGALDPNTVRVIERNLGVIEQAIADSREALLLDPGNAFLVEHLERMYRRKLVYLQDAVRVAQWSG